MNVPSRSVVLTIALVVGLMLSVGLAQQDLAVVPRIGVVDLEPPAIEGDEFAVGDPLIERGCRPCGGVDLAGAFGGERRVHRRAAA